MKLLQATVTDQHIHAFIELEDGTSGLLEADMTGKSWKDGLPKWEWQCMPPEREKEIKHAFCALVASGEIRRGME